MKRIVIKEVGDDRRDFHTTFEVSEDAFHKFMRPLRETSDPYLEKIGEKGASVVRRAFALEGVNVVCVYPYQIVVEIGKAFTWVWEGTDIIQEILKAIAEAFGPADQVIDESPKTISLGSSGDEPLVIDLGDPDPKPEPDLVIHLDPKPEGEGN